MISNLKDLERLLKLCRAQGVQEIDVHGVSFKLGALPDPPGKPEANPTQPYANFPDGELSPTQLMFYSAGGMPEDDPELQGNQQ